MASEREKTNAILEEILSAIESSGGAGGPKQSAAERRAAMARGAGQDGLLGGGLGGLGRAAGALATGAIGQTVGAGLVNQERGGSFSAGFERSAISLLAKVPIFGELRGAAGLNRQAQGAESDLNAITNQIAKVAGPDAISGRVRNLLANRATVQNANLEQDRQRNSVAANQAAQNRNGGSLFTLENGARAATTALEDFTRGLRASSIAQTFGFGGAG